MNTNQIQSGAFGRTTSVYLPTGSLKRRKGKPFSLESLENRQLFSAGLIIKPIFDSSIASRPNAAAIEAALNTAIANFESDISTPITVTVKFDAITSGLAESQTYHLLEPYTSYVSALASHATDATDAAAVASLPKTTNNPVNGGADILLSDPNARALGFAAAPPGGIDSTIGFNLSLFNLTRTSINPSHYDLVASASHELDEVLGIDSTLNFYNSGVALPKTYVAAEDLFRYSAAGVRSYSTSPSAYDYFSYNGGTTPIARFNQTKGGDFNDWYSPGTQVAQVQDAYGTEGATPNLGTELIVLDTLGYKLAPGVAGGFRADLIPLPLASWSSPLVVTTVKGALTDSTSLTTADTVYLDAAVKNEGERPTTASETNTIVLDGKTIFTFTDPAGLAVGNAYFSIGLSLGKLSAGEHTITINANTTGSVSEIITSNDSYTRSFTVTGAATPLPDLAPYTPSGWTAPLVVTTSSTAKTDPATIAAGSTLYIDAAYANFGTVATPSSAKFLTIIKLDGATVATLEETSPPLAADSFYYFPGIKIGAAKAGKHTIEMIIDSTDLVTESNKANNTYTTTFTVA